jgi:hypothetical protein
MKILNNSCTNQKTNSNVTIVPNSSFACLPSSNHHYQISDRTLSIGRFNTLGLTTIDPQLSSVCGADTLTIRGNLQICDNLIVNGTMTVTGDSTLVNLTVTGHLDACDISACNIDISQNLTVAGHTTLVDVSAANIDILQNLTVAGHTTLVDVSANIIEYKNNSQFFNWGVHIIPKDGVTFKLGLISKISTTAGLTITNCPIVWNRNRLGGWIYPGYGSYGVVKNDHPPNSTWSDRGSYPTDGFENIAGEYSYAIGLTIPFDGKIIGGFSRFSWTLGRYLPSGGGIPFALNMEVYIIKCNGNIPAAPERIAIMQIDKKCGRTNWGDVASGINWPSAPDVVVSAGDALGLFITSNTDDIHSPATFTLEVQRDY